MHGKCAEQCLAHNQPLLEISAFSVSTGEAEQWGLHLLVMDRGWGHEARPQDSRGPILKHNMT